jgi:hypothetical protein
VNHQGGEPDPERENVNDCAFDEVVRRDRLKMMSPTEFRRGLAV